MPWPTEVQLPAERTPCRTYSLQIIRQFSFLAAQNAPSQRPRRAFNTRSCRWFVVARSVDKVFRPKNVAPRFAFHSGKPYTDYSKPRDREVPSIPRSHVLAAMDMGFGAPLSPYTGHCGRLSQGEIRQL